MTRYETCRVALTESFADYPDVLDEILVAVARLPGDGNPESYIQEMRVVIISVVERWIAASKAEAEALRQREEFRATDTSATIH